MDGKNKKSDNQQEIPAASSAWPKNSIDASSFSFMSPSNLPLAPSSFHVRQKPYFMNHVDAGARSSVTKTGFFQGSDPLSMKGENNKKTDQNSFPPSDQNLTLETSGGDNSAKTEVGNGGQVGRGRTRTLDPNMDPVKLKRAISNRLSAQKSRIKKLQYVSDMERKVEYLQTLIAVLSPQVTLYRNKKYLLQMEQKNLNQRITACDNHKILVEAEIEERRAEVTRLRQLHLTQQQQQQKMQAQTSWGFWEHGLTDQQMVNPGLNQPRIGLSMYANSDQEINMLNQQQEKPVQILMPGWEPGRGGQLTNYVGLDQSGSGQVQNPSLNQSNQLPKGSVNSNFGGLEQILQNINPEYQNPRNDHFI